MSRERQPGMPRLGMQPLGVGGYLACLAFAIGVGVVAQGGRLAVACGVVLLMAGVYFPTALRVVADKRFVLFLLLVLLWPALLIEPMTHKVGPIALSEQGAALGVHMAVRAIAIAVAVSGFTASVAVGELSRLLEQVGFKGLGFALGVAMNMLPIVRETTTTVFQALRMRGGFRQRRLQALRMLLVTIIVQSLRHADNIVNAAEARAFAVERIHPAPAVALRRDVHVYIALLAAAVALLLPINLFV
jgi:energy-coupling factor transporter transmembrane protein EcfT